MPRRVGVAFFSDMMQINRFREPRIQLLSKHLPQAQATQLNSDISPKLDLSIEGMRSQQFSEGVFAFLMVGVAVFTVILIILLVGKHRPKETKFGERLMFGAILLGVIAAVAFGAMQMLEGYLF